MNLSTQNLAGPGDPITWGPVCHPADPRWEDEFDEEARDAAIEELFQSRMAMPAWVSDAQGDFTQEEYDAITAMVIGGDAKALGEKLIEAVQRVVRAGCERDVDTELESMRREAEEEAAAARMGC